MYHAKITTDAQANAGFNNEIGLRRFLDEHWEAIANSAALLAGTKGARIVGEIFTGLANQETITRRIRKKMFELYDILTLENVHDENSPEAAHFAMIDPSDPVVLDICFMADGLGDALKSAGLEHPQTSRETIE